MKTPPNPDRGIRQTIIGLTVSAVVLMTAGALTQTLWLFGIGAWALITAVLTGLIYRP